MLVKSKLSLVDDVGEVFIDDEKIYRGINSQYISVTREIMECGLIDELVNQKLFPETIISNQKLMGYDFVLEHRKIDPVIYPFEWSPEMLRNAGLTILEVNDVCRKYGYELKDAQPYNLVYDGNNCLFVDLGSIQKIQTDHNICLFAEEFLRSYYYPLYIYSKGANYLYSVSFLRIGGIIPHIDFILFKSSFLSILPNRIIKKIIDYYFIYNRLYFINNDLVKQKLPFAVYKIFNKLKKYRMFLFSGYSSSFLRKKISSLNIKIETQWASYHEKSGFISHYGETKLTDRFEFVLQLIRKYKPTSVLELAGNQGVLSCEISKNINIKNVVCSDYDEQAIDTLFRSIKATNISNVTPVVFNLICPPNRCFSEPIEERLKSELVIALAVTHHLMLTQKFKLEIILDRILMFTNKYLIIEYMPLGLFDGKKSPSIPSWYTKEFFINELNKKFKILEERQVEINRIIFIAEKINK